MENSSWGILSLGEYPIFGWSRGSVEQPSIRTFISTCRKSQNGGIITGHGMLEKSTPSLEGGYWAVQAPTMRGLGLGSRYEVA